MESYGVHEGARGEGERLQEVCEELILLSTNYAAERSPGITPNPYVAPIWTTGHIKGVLMKGNSTSYISVPLVSCLLHASS